MQQLKFISKYALVLSLLCLINRASARERVGGSLKHDYPSYYIQNEGAISVKVVKGPI